MHPGLNQKNEDDGNNDYRVTNCNFNNDGHFFGQRNSTKSKVMILFAVSTPMKYELLMSALYKALAEEVSTDKQKQYEDLVTELNSTIQRFDSVSPTIDSHGRPHR